MQLLNPASLICVKWQDRNMVRNGMNGRRLYIVVFVVGLLFSTSVLAQSDAPVDKICEQLQLYDEGGSNFVPGVDVHGNAVPPADLGPQSSGIYDPLILPIFVNLSDRLGQNTRALEVKPEVAYLEIYADGRVLFNGEDIGDTLRQTCLLKNPDILFNRDGQKSADPLVSGDNNPAQGMNGGANQ